jgi:hypothetical protein
MENEKKTKNVKVNTKKYKRKTSSIYDSYRREDDSWSNGNYDDDYTRSSDIHYDRNDY